MTYSDDVIVETKKLINELKDTISTPSLRNKYYGPIGAIENSLDEPCRLAITGRVKAGKSSLINVLLGGDYAVVGTTETTATINIFRYGNPPTAEKPILCEFVDGNKEWISRSELDKLQGTSEGVVTKIAEIKQITYFLKDERLINTILIDTPGLDAMVGAEGDAHQAQTEEFLGLRKRHEEETIIISNNADAVVFLLGDVVHNSDVDFISNFLSNQKASCLNTIGVMSQIDLTDERVRNRNEIAKECYDKFSEYVNCVIPISAGIRKYLPSTEEAHRIKEAIDKVPSKNISTLFISHNVYFRPEIPGIPLSLEERKSIYPSSIPFRCFAIIAKTLYEHNVDDSLRLLNDISGIDRLKITLDKQFFERSKQIKAEVGIKQILSILWNILNCDSELLKGSFTEDEYKHLIGKFHQTQLALESLVQGATKTNAYFQALVSLVGNKCLFLDDEYEELRKLFEGEICECSSKRLDYWYKEKNNSSVEIRRDIANLAYQKYTDLAFL